MPIVYTNTLIAKIIYDWKSRSDSIEYVSQKYGIPKVDCYCLIIEHYHFKEPSKNTITITIESKLNFGEKEINYL